MLKRARMPEKVVAKRPSSTPGSPSLVLALRSLVIFALEHDGEEDREVEKSITRALIKIEHVEAKRTKRWGRCAKCGEASHKVVCWRCKQDMPARLRRLDICAIESVDRREVDAEIVEWAGKDRFRKQTNQATS